MTREEAIEQLKLWLNYLYPDTDVYHAVAMAIVALQVQKTGRWIWVQYDSNPEIGNHHCSVCGFIPACFNLARKHLNYCPKCGADMRGAEE